MKLRMTEILNGLNKEYKRHRFVLDSFKNTVPFVFSDHNPCASENVRTIKNHSISDVKNDIESIKIAPPFPVTSYEFETINIVNYSPSEGEERRVHAMHCIEISPDSFMFTLLYDTVRDFNRTRFTNIITESLKPEEYANCKMLLQKLLRQINSKKHGVVKQKRAYKFNKGKGEKRCFKQSKFVYINSSKSEQRERIGGKKIEYSNGFYVSAHWRKTRKPDSMGLNREGERCVKGLTWVGHYFKGEDPIIKIRKVK